MLEGKMVSWICFGDRITSDGFSGWDERVYEV
jgi:hypothetical protein